MTIPYRIVENALIARISAYNLKKNRCAIVVGSTIYLWGINKQDFLSDERYLKHELQHIFQYHQLGVVRFVILYLIESARVGYYNNKFEVEARAAEEGDLKAEYELVE